MGVLVGSALPGADAEPLLDLQGLGKEGTQPDSRSYRTEPPLARIGADLTQNPETDLFTVSSPVREYWRIAALDVYESTNGGEWTLTATGSDEVVEGLSGDAPRGAVAQAYEIGALDGRWIPAAYEAVSIEGTTPLVVRASRTLVTGREGLRNLKYTVESVLPPGSQSEITPDQIAGTDRPVPKAFTKYTDLPSDFPSDVKAAGRADRRRRGHALRPGGRARGVLPEPRQRLRVLARDGSHVGRAERGRDQRLPRSGEPQGLLRAVRRQLRRHGPLGRAPDARRRGLHHR